MREVYELLARVVDYPTAALGEDAGRCASALEESCPDAARWLKMFVDSLEGCTKGDIEEAYCVSFDFNADASLYIGHHLFGGDWRRSMFMAELNHRYGESGFSCGSEMPDHLGVLLRFLSHAPDMPESDELRNDCIVPALRRALTAIEGKQGLYTPVFRSLVAFFERGVHGT